jgi:UDP-N-acetylmuramyl-tripeptide synthetase
MNLSNLITGISKRKVLGNENIEIKSIQFDSRKLEAGDVFVATRGTVVDGHDFIGTAIEKGAVAIVCEDLPANPTSATLIQVENSAEALGIMACNFYDNPSRKLKLVGVTGTNGKTTIVTLLYKLFRKLGYGAGLLSTVCNYVNDEVIEATHTTPNPLELNSLLAKMVEAGCEYAFMEVSSHSIEQQRVAGLVFDGGIFTNLTRDHIDYHLTFENYLKAKKTFFDKLPANAFALTNLDDRNGEVMLQNTKARKYSYSLREMASFKTKILEHGFEGMQLQMEQKINGKEPGRFEIYTPFIGNFNASNLTAVFGAAALLVDNEQFTAEINFQSLLCVISELTPVSGRFEAIRAPQGFTAIVDYAHTPDALTNVISTINEILQYSEGRLITVVGCGGNRDKGKRPMMAREAVNGSWKAILTSDNPRNEDPQEILNDMLAGLDNSQKAKSLTITDRREAIKTACTLADKGDIILIAGKGHEDYQIINGVKHHFDDREEVLLVVNG